MQNESYIIIKAAVYSDEVQDEIAYAVDSKGVVVTVNASALYELSWDEVSDIELLSEKLALEQVFVFKEIVLMLGKINKNKLYGPLA